MNAKAGPEMALPFFVCFYSKSMIFFLSQKSTVVGVMRSFSK
jgi:hypothetical protein